MILMLSDQDGPNLLHFSKTDHLTVFRSSSSAELMGLSKKLGFAFVKNKNVLYLFKKNVKKVKKETTGNIYTNYMETFEAVSSSSGQLEPNFQSNHFF